MPSIVCSDHLLPRTAQPHASQRPPRRRTLTQRRQNQRTWRIGTIGRGHVYPRQMSVPTTVTPRRPGLSLHGKRRDRSLMMRGPRTARKQKTHPPLLGHRAGQRHLMPQAKLRRPPGIRIRASRQPIRIGAQRRPRPPDRARGTEPNKPPRPHRPRPRAHRLRPPDRARGTEPNKPPRPHRPKPRAHRLRPPDRARGTEPNKPPRPHRPKPRARRPRSSAKSRAN